jgi:glycosyltransferase involved in cell wall biosynthesis
VSQRTLLMLTYHFPPSAASGSFRLLGFARHLVAQGWRTAVVAPPGLPWEPVDPGLVDRVPGETTVYQVPYMKSRLARKCAMYKGWLPRGGRACRTAVREQRPAVVLTSGPPHDVHWLGWWLKWRYGLPWIADFRDPWFSEGGFDRLESQGCWRVRMQESVLLRASDRVIANAPGACRALQERYPQLAEKFVTIPNGYDRETFEAVTAETRSRQPGAPIRVLHAGAMYSGRDPLPFLDAIQTLSDPRVTRSRSWDMRFLGPPPESGLDLPKAVASRGLGECVSIAGQVPYDRALREMAGADILLLMDSPGRSVGVPAKLYEYIGAGRPVLALGERGGDLALVLEGSGIPYRIAAPSDSAAIVSALSELADEIEAAGPAFAPRTTHPYSREALTGQLAALLNRCAGFEAEQGRGRSDVSGRLQTASVGLGDS